MVPPLDGVNRITLARFTGTDIYENLSREELLFEGCGADELRFLLYVDSPCVVIGKHQNPWREAAAWRVKRGLLTLARRISGGGTVYHDLGNLNFSFILPKRLFDRRFNLEVVVSALERLGIHATVSPRYDIMVAERKVSGNAFCFRRELALHHGTLLVRSRLGDLHDALSGMEGITTRAVESHPQPVLNLEEAVPGLSIDDMARALFNEVQRVWGDRIRQPGSPAPRAQLLDDNIVGDEELAPHVERNRSFDWLFGRTPTFTVKIGASPDDAETAGAGSFEATVEEGRISKVSGAQAEKLTQRLAGLPFDSRELTRALGGEPGHDSLVRWLSSHPF
ncbi:MAG TPA: lipoate--protein ligase family protein [Spirochaetia bacterium]|nr:lipoate--protein ligase family protein [Spirochaetia bacterium]